MIIKSFFRKKTTKIYLALINIMSVFIMIFVFCIYYLNSILIQHESEKLVFFENYNSKYDVNEACALVNVQNEGVKELLEEYELNNKTIIKFSNKIDDKEASIIFTKNTEIQNKIKSIEIYQIYHKQALDYKHQALLLELLGHHFFFLMLLMVSLPY